MRSNYFILRQHALLKLSNGPLVLGLLDWLLLLLQLSLRSIREVEHNLGGRGGGGRLLWLCLCRDSRRLLVHHLQLVLQALQFRQQVLLKVTSRAHMSNDAPRQDTFRHDPATGTYIFEDIFGISSESFRDLVGNVSLVFHVLHYVVDLLRVPVCVDIVSATKDRQTNRQSQPHSKSIG